MLSRNGSLLTVWLVALVCVFFVQVLGINSALTNVMVTNEPISEPECATDLFELDAMDMLDITGMSDGEQDELLSLLFGHNIDPNDMKQGFILCRDGDKISM